MFPSWEEINKQMQGERRSKFLASDQIDLGTLISKLQPIAAKQAGVIEQYQHEAKVMFDFEYFFPVRFDSWRGIYSELCLNFATFEHKPGTPEPLTVSAFLEMAKGVIGKTFTGYKGGEYTIKTTTPIWVANYGNSGNTALVDVFDNGYEVVLITKWMET